MHESEGHDIKFVPCGIDFYSGDHVVQKKKSSGHEGGVQDPLVE